MQERQNRSTFNVLFIIKKAKLLKSGEAPICMRVTVNKQVVEILVKRSIDIKEWNQVKGCSKAKTNAGRELNHYLEVMRSRLLKIHREMQQDDDLITAITLRDRFYGKDDSCETLVEVYAEHNAKCRALIGIDYSQSTVDKFDTSLSHIREYMRHKYGREDLLLREITSEYVTEFEFYLKKVKECQHNTAIKHLKNLKKVIRIALTNDWMKRDPFIGIHFKHTEVHPEFLTQEELTRLMDKKFTIERIGVIRDIYCFCALTGLAFSDVKQLRTEHIVSDNNGALWIRKARQKTGNMCNIPLLSSAIAILARYKDHPKCVESGLLLPVPSNQRTNAYLKEIADLCGINKRLCTHTARHTAATTTFLANGVSMENVAKILGHSDTKMTQHYAKVLDSSIMRDMSRVEQAIPKYNQ